MQHPTETIMENQNQQNVLILFAIILFIKILDILHILDILKVLKIVCILSPNILIILLIAQLNVRVARHQ